MSSRSGGARRKTAGATTTKAVSARTTKAKPSAEEQRAATERRLQQRIDRAFDALQRADAHEREVMAHVRAVADVGKAEDAMKAAESRNQSALVHGRVPADVRAARAEYQRVVTTNKRLATQAREAQRKLAAAQKRYQDAQIARTETEIPNPRQIIMEGPGSALWTRLGLYRELTHGYAPMSPERAARFVAAHKAVSPATARALWNSGEAANREPIHTADQNLHLEAALRDAARRGEFDETTNRWTGGGRSGEPRDRTKHPVWYDAVS